jgi:hypothetical protein
MQIPPRRFCFFLFDLIHVKRKKENIYYAFSTITQERYFDNSQTGLSSVFSLNKPA